MKSQSCDYCYHSNSVDRGYHDSPSFVSIFLALPCPSGSSASPRARFFDPWLVDADSPVVADTVGGGAMLVSADLLLFLSDIDTSSWNSGETCSFFGVSAGVSVLGLT